MLKVLWGGWNTYGKRFERRVREFVLTQVSSSIGIREVYFAVGWLGSGRLNMASNSQKTLLVDLPPDRLGAIVEIEGT